MGIRGLAGLIRWRAPHARSIINWGSSSSRYAGQRWAIDASCLLFRARAAKLDIPTVIAGLIVRLRRAGIEPVFVFDGKPPPAKDSVVKHRCEVRESVKREIEEIRTAAAAAAGAGTEAEPVTEEQIAALEAKIPVITTQDRNEIKRLLYAAGVLGITASGEADDLLGYLARTGQVHAVVSTDMDMLARGVRVLVQPETPDAGMLTELSLVDVLAALKLTYRQFVDACMLMGSDYTPREVRTLAPPAAISAVHRGEMLPEACAAGAALLRGDGVVWDDLLDERQREKWIGGPPPVELENLIRIAAARSWSADWVSTLSGAR